MGNARFSIKRRLGSGGMGVVYHAHDTLRGVDVALKTLRHADATALYRFKREFRALADVRHPNLVALHELFSEDELWFFTMELVHGVTFLEHVRRSGPLARDRSTLDFSSPTLFEDTQAGDGDTMAHADTMRAPPPIGDRTILDLPATIEKTQPAQPALQPKSAPKVIPPRPHIPRLRAALRQLAEGLNALHDAGKLHRDIKPSNVMVTATGRAVILDFGLVREISPDASGGETMIAGTVSYMAPEQLTEDVLTPAVDWYAVGVMLYEALAGRVPFPGLGLDVLFKKQRQDPEPPSAYAEHLPADLEALAMELLRRAPADRPTGREVLRRLGVEGRATSAAAMSRSSVVPAAGAPFIGREPHLSALHAAFAAVKPGHPVAAYVRGRSGMGKSALVRRFQREAKEKHGAVVLAGRCYERESVPYKALDSIVDALSRHLSALDEQDARALLPPGMRSLARLFPVLGRVEAVELLPPAPVESPDPQELKRRAFIAFKELLRNIAATAPLVLMIDDLQWGDVDSVRLLTDLLRPPDPLSILVVGCFRSEQEADSPVVGSLLRGKEVIAGELRTITVGPLSHEEAWALARASLGRDVSDEEAQSRAQQIAQEAQGNPFFIEVLARHAKREVRTDTDPALLTLETVLLARAARLSPAARGLLETVSVCGRPIEEEVAFAATDLSAADRHSAVDALRTGNFILTAQVNGRDMIEVFHNKIRETIVAHLDREALREKHRRLARALEDAGSPDHEAVAAHFREHGDLARAARHTEAAADRASAAFAFDRAAELYREARGLLAGEPARRAAICEKLGMALANAGRGHEAAEAFLDAADRADPEHALELRRRAGEQYLISGHLDEGLASLEAVLAAVELEIPKTPRRAYASRALLRAQLWRRGFAFTERTEAQLAPRERLKIDVLWSAATGLAMADHMKGAELQTRQLLAALEAGEPRRVGRALAMEAAYASTSGGTSKTRVESLIEMAAELAAKLDDPQALALVAFARGAAAYLAGQWLEARQLLEAAEVMLRDRCTGVHWELATTHSLLHGALYFLGDLPELTRRTEALREEAEVRGNLYQLTALSIGHSNAVWLAADNPERARTVVDEAMRRWSHGGYHIQHVLALQSRSHESLYSGRGLECHERLTEAWPSLQGAMMLRPQYLRISAHYLRAQALLAAAREVPSRATRLAGAAERDAKALESEKAPWSDALASAVWAGIAAAAGEDAAPKMRAALDGFERAGMKLHAAAARLWLGERDRAVIEMGAMGIKNPARFAATLLP